MLSFNVFYETSGPVNRFSTPVQGFRLRVAYDFIATFIRVHFLGGKLYKRHKEGLVSRESRATTADLSSP